MNLFIKKSWPVLFLLGVWFLFASPYLVTQLVPYPADYLVSSFTPWNAYEEYHRPFKNPLISDVINQLYPWKVYTISALKEGSIPWWNPYSFSGNPHVANYQTAVFSPFNLFFFVLPFIDAWSILILVQPLIAGLGTYLFLQIRKISVVGRLIGSISFMFCGFIVGWMPWGTLSMAIAFLPWVLVSIGKLFSSTKHGFWWGMLLSFSLLTSFFSGHFQTSLYLFLFSGAYLLFLYFNTKKQKPFFLTLMFFLIGISVSLMQIIPTILFYSQSLRSELGNTSGGIPYYYLLTLIAPDFFGNPVTRNDWLGHYTEWATFIGVIPFVLAIGSLFLFRKNAEVRFFAIASIVAVILAIDSPLQMIRSQLGIPIFSTSIPTRIMVLASFSLSILAGFGFDALSKQTKAHRKRILFFGGFAVFFILVWIVVLFSPLLSVEQSATAKRNLILPSALFLFMSTSFLLMNKFRKKQLVLILSFLILLGATIDSVRFAQKWMPFAARELVYPELDVLAAMQKQRGEGRVYGDYKAYIDTYYQIPGIDGYDPLYSKRYGEFIQSAETGKFTEARVSEVLLAKQGKYSKRVLDLLGVTLIYQPNSFMNQPWAFPVWEDREKYEEIYHDDMMQLFANHGSLPRATLFYDYEVIPDNKKLVERFYEKEFDFRKVLLLEEKPAVRIMNKESRSKGKVTITSYEQNRIIIKVVTDEPGLLFLSDTYYPSWKATVNGKETKIYQADYAFRAVIVPSGKSTVEFSYTPFR